jgi:hypothetical protein
MTATPSIKVTVPGAFDGVTCAVKVTATPKIADDGVTVDSVVVVD